jgi:hypothetical protein
MDVTPEQLAEILVMSAVTGNNGSFVQTNLQGMDNEMIVQISAHIFRHMAMLVNANISDASEESNSSSDEYESSSSTSEESEQSQPDREASVIDTVTIFNSTKMILLMIGFTVHHERVDRSSLNKIIHYATITDSGLTRSPFHPLHLLTLMPEASAPDVYRKLMSNVDYLPNIILLYDPDHTSAHVYTMVIQKVNIHIN